MVGSAFVVCSLLALSVLVSGQLKYSCDVHGTAVGATCVQTTGVQTCGGGAFGYLCETGGGVCPTGGAACDTTGTADDGGNPACTAGSTCICADGYDGARCSDKLLSAVCDSAEMTVSVKNYVPLTGGPYSHNYYFSETTTFDFTPGHVCAVESNADVTFTSDPLEYPTATGCTAVPQDEAFGGVTYKVIYMYLQHINSFQLQTDQVYKIMCDPLGGNVITNELGTIRANTDDIQTTHSKVEDAIMDLKEDAAGSTYNEITGPIALGTPVSLIIQHPLLFTLHTCQAASDAGFTTPIDLIDATQCVTNPSNLLFNGDIAYAQNGAGQTAEGGQENMYVYRLPLKAWIWPSSVDVYLRCFMCFSQTCAQTTDGCALVSTIDDALFAQYATLNPNRRRRQVRAANTTLELSVSVRVQDPTSDGNVILTNGGNSNTKDADVSSCYSSVSVLLPLILLAVLLLVAMVMTFFFCTRVSRDRELRESRDNMAYKS